MPNIQIVTLMLAFTSFILYLISCKILLSPYTVLVTTLPVQV